MPIITKNELLEFSNTELQRNLDSLKSSYMKNLYNFVIESSENIFQEINEALKAKSRRRETSLSYEISGVSEIFEKCKEHFKKTISENVKKFSKSENIQVKIEETEYDLIAEVKIGEEIGIVITRFSKREIINYIQSAVSKAGYVCSIIGNVLHITWEYL